MEKTKGKKIAFVTGTILLIVALLRNTLVLSMLVFILLTVYKTEIGTFDDLFDNKLEKWAEDIQNLENPESIFGTSKDIFGVPYSESENREQNERKLKAGMIIYANADVVTDVALPDGGWLIGGDEMYMNLQDADENRTICEIDTSKILPFYRNYTQNNKYVTWEPYGIKELIKNNSIEWKTHYVWYELVIDKFYLEDRRVLPQKVSIYRKEGSGEDDDEVVFQESVEFDYPEKELDNLLLFSTEEELIPDEVGKTVPRYQYTDQDGKYLLEGSMYLMTEHYYTENDVPSNSSTDSRVGRKQLRDESVSDKKPGLIERLPGLRKSSNGHKELVSNYYGGAVKIVWGKNSYSYAVCKLLWLWIVIYALVGILLLIGICVLIKKYKKVS